MKARTFKISLAVFMLLAAPLAAESLFVNYLQSDGFYADDNKSIAIDSAGVVWIGGRGTGVTAYDGENFIQYNSANSGLSDFPVRNILIDSRQRIWFCQAGNGVVVYDGTSWTGYDYNDGLIGNSTFMAAETEGGSIYVGTNLGLGVLTDGIWSAYDISNGLAENWVNFVFIDRTNSVWLGYKTMGISLGNPLAGWTNQDWLPEANATEIRVIGEDRQGNLWAGTRGRGVVRYDGTEWKVFTSADGLGSDSVWDMAVDSSGGVWFATYGGGLSHFNGSRWDTYTKEDAEVESNGWNWVSGVAAAEDGSIWLATGVTISYLPVANIRGLIAGCDVNGDGRINVADVMALLLIQRSNPGDPRADHNGDGSVEIGDVIGLLEDIRGGACAE